ncbi:hypothetical protein CEUSTIGMA_g2055.t1 [Chlamydomonas eustigma]|uniref:S-adenosyl-L-methionine-dependent methyltransferase n=1 Tax=Chlamydomonas eustigma TaxID=1157962 RepID=A0A250WUV4_9CHLO|nr:hypothetical protein CEUSTIGMA_g2055.t1 [Chlamydomonas eustigma]|eukprot:GAX74607.1 hypothetical protein CEUSTIGMA_g2055.t1 [Chlamydomonas eustigma]
MSTKAEALITRIAVPASLLVATAYIFQRLVKWRGYNSKRNQAAKEVWSNLTPVERTAVGVCLYRCNMLSTLKSINKYWNPEFDQALVSHCMPLEEQAKGYGGRGGWGNSMMAVRTSEIDFQAMETVMGCSEIRQVVILGAGLDPRAWRLAWPEGTRVFEVDTGSVEKVKSKVLVPMKMGASSRAFVPADLSKALQPGDSLADKLAVAGFDSREQCLWIAEGLIGYMTAEEGGNLIKAMYQACAPGSKMVMTCPPTVKHKEESIAAGHPLLHTTYEEGEDLLKRVQAQGWQAHLNTGEALGKKFGFDKFHQGQVVGKKV